MLHFEENFQHLYNWCILLGVFHAKDKRPHHIN